MPANEFAAGRRKAEKSQSRTRRTVKFSCPRRRTSGFSLPAANSFAGTHARDLFFKLIRYLPFAIRNPKSKRSLKRRAQFGAFVLAARARVAVVVNEVDLNFGLVAFQKIIQPQRVILQRRVALATVGIEIIVAEQTLQFGREHVTDGGIITRDVATRRRDAGRSAVGLCQSNWHRVAAQIFAGGVDFVFIIGREQVEQSAVGAPRLRDGARRGCHARIARAARNAKRQVFHAVISQTSQKRFVVGQREGVLAVADAVENADFHIEIAKCRVQLHAGVAHVAVTAAETDRAK